MVGGLTSLMRKGMVKKQSRGISNCELKLNSMKQTGGRKLREYKKSDLRQN
jgi:hypothetical protein